MGIGIAGVVLLLAMIVLSYQGFKNDSFKMRYCFWIDAIRQQRQWDRMIVSGFLHNNGWHLFFNALALFFFSGYLEGTFGVLPFLLIFFGSLLGGNFLELVLHRFNGGYTSLGASGAVSGMIFATIAVMPGIQIMFIPGWLFGIVYVGFTLYSIRQRGSQTAHEGHLGGAITGMLLLALLYPSIALQNWLVIVAITVPALVLIYLFATRPQILIGDANLLGKSKTRYTVDEQYNIDRRERQQQVDAILDKIARKGMNALSQKERDILKEHARSLQ